jgi:hypothetical protein
LHFEHEGSDVITIDFEHTENATSYSSTNNVINKNDILGSLRIYNAKSSGINSNYTVAIERIDGTSLPYEDATYDSTDEFLTWKAD